MTKKSSDQLIELIQQLEHISGQLNSTLKKEHAVLKLKDSQQLLELSDEKKALVTHLENHTKTTHIFLRNMNINKGLYGFSDALSSLAPGGIKTLLEKAWSNIQALAEDNKKLNQINGSIIELNRRHTQRSLDVLRGQASTTTSTYGADGHAANSKVSRNISIA